ncbi:MAG: TonB-dependent receptor plug domain-containing protein, partial [Opitutaceae bacterium]
MSTSHPRDLQTALGHPGPLTTLHRLASCSILALAIAGSAYAQTAPAPAAPASTVTAASATSSAADEPVQLGAFVVNGYANSLATSLQAKRESVDNVEVISAEDVGKFPDTNLAESLSHLPGVSVDYLFGEGERVSIEGTDPNLNRVLLNG